MRRFSTLLMAALLISGAWAPGCNLLSGSNDDSDVNGAIGAADPKLAKEPVPPRLVAANTRFAFNLYRNLTRAPLARNVVISPASISLALTMTYNGANGTTKSAMAQALELDEMTLEEANQANLVLLSNLAYADETVRLAIANSLWARQGMNFDEDFLERNRHFYGARVSALDFNAPSSVDTINGWVSANTQGKIPTIIDEISGDAILFLINAIYFKGEWTDKFDAQATSPADFSLFSGARKSIPMMRRHGRFSHLENDRFEAVSLPYGNGRFSMFVFLPKANSSLSELNETLTATNWSNWVAQFDTMAGTVGLPRFETTYEELLNEALIQLGMGVAFDQARADFSGMLPVSPAANAFISKVKHKTFLRVDEEGSEAAAVTSVEIRLTSAPISFNMIVDRPFFFAICDNKSKSLLFLGSIIDPS